MAKLGNIVTTFESEQLSAEADANFAIGPQVTDAVSEMDQGISGIENVDEAISDATAAVAQIEEVQEHIAEGGVLTPVEVAVVESLHTSIMNRLGLSTKTLTTESHQTPTRENLVSTLEDNKSGIVSKIVAAFKAAINMITGFVSGLLQNRTLLRKYLEGVKSKIADYNEERSDKKVTSKFEDGNSAIKILADSEKLIDFADTAVKNLSPLTKDIESAIFVNGVNFMKALEPDDGPIRDMHLAGGEILKVYVPNKDNQTKLVLQPEAAEQPIKEGDRLTSAECHKVIDNALRTLKELDRVQKFSNSAVYLLKSIVSYVSMYANAAKVFVGKTFSSGKMVVSGAIGLVSSGGLIVVRSMLQKITTRVPSIVFKQIKAAGDYVKASL